MTTTYRILLLESPHSKNGVFEVDGTTNVPCPPGFTVFNLKTWIVDQTGYHTLIKDQHLFAHHLTSTQANQTKPLADDIQLNSLGVTNLSLIITSKTNRMSVTDGFLEGKLPHIGLTHRKELLTQLQSFPTDQLDLNSIHETPVKATTTKQSHMIKVSIRNYTTNKFVAHIIIDGEEFVPHHVDEETKKVEFRSKYSYQYSAASDEYVKEVTEAKAKYESNVAHCKKLLHELPIALANSQIKLAEDTKSVREHSAQGIELSDLGALLVEQSVIAEEIKTQQERLPQLAQLKPDDFNKSKFIVHEFQSQIELSFGWHKFNGTIYELIPKPSVEEVDSLLQPNQHPVSVKRTRQQFESGQQ